MGAGLSRAGLQPGFANLVTRSTFTSRAAHADARGASRPHTGNNYLALLLRHPVDQPEPVTIEADSIHAVVSPQRDCGELKRVFGQILNNQDGRLFLCRCCRQKPWNSTVQAAIILAQHAVQTVPSLFLQTLRADDAVVNFRRFRIRRVDDSDSGRTSQSPAGVKKSHFS